jgi:uracil-DNA glycosylase
MFKSRRVLSNLNGAWNAQILFVAEAPGRLGAEVTGIPLFGDRTGDRFGELLSAMGWRRHGIFITNAVLCNPRDAAGNNSTPTRQEIKNCSCLLQRTIEIIDPLVVVALGRVALEGLKLVATHNLTLRSSAGRVFPWNKRMLGVLYHPGPRTVIHRSWKRQITDARKLAAQSSRFLGKVRRKNLDLQKRSDVLHFPALS